MCVTNSRHEREQHQAKPNRGKPKPNRGTFCSTSWTSLQGLEKCPFPPSVSLRSVNKFDLCHPAVMGTPVLTVFMFLCFFSCGVCCWADLQCQQEDQGPRVEFWSWFYIAVSPTWRGRERERGRVRERERERERGREESAERKKVWGLHNFHLPNALQGESFDNHI